MCMQGVAGWPPEKRVGMQVMGEEEAASFTAMRM